jgi:hypothetical protein
MPSMVDRPVDETAALSSCYFAGYPTFSLHILAQHLVRNNVYNKISKHSLLHLVTRLVVTMLSRASQVASAYSHILGLPSCPKNGNEATEMSKLFAGIVQDAFR